jgi:hypothetical protein
MRAIRSDQSINISSFYSTHVLISRCERSDQINQSTQLVLFYSRTNCYAPVLSRSTSHLVISSTLSIRQACLTALVTLQSIEPFDSLIMLRFSANVLRNEQEISNENSPERFTKRFTSWYSHHDLKTTWRRQVDESRSTSKLFIS